MNRFLYKLIKKANIIWELRIMESKYNFLIDRNIPFNEEKAQALD